MLESYSSVGFRLLSELYSHLLYGDNRTMVSTQVCEFPSPIGVIFSLMIVIEMSID